MVIAINPKALLRHVCKSDWALPRDQQTVFLIRVLDLTDSGHLKDLLAVEGGPRIGAYEVAALRLGLAGIENLRSADGAEVRMETEEREVFGRKRPVASDAFLQSLPPDVRQDLLGAITSQRVTEDERKNS